MVKVSGKKSKSKNTQVKLTKKPTKVYIIAGEESGDQLGGRLMSALARLSKRDIHFYGVGGQTMTQNGLSSLFDMTELSVMGLLGSFTKNS